MKLFSTSKTGVTLETITHKMEKRKSGETKVIVLGCKVFPFDHKLALAIDEAVRVSLFKRSGNGDPLVHVRGLDFALPIERQDVDMYASPDTEKATIRFEQVKVSDLRARIEKGSNTFVLTFKLVYGPASDRDLEYVEAWRTTMRFPTFHESEPDLDFEEVPEAAPEDDDQQRLGLADEPQPRSVGAAAALKPKKTPKRKRR